MNHEKIFSITSSAQFEGVALEIFRYQYEKIEVYRNFCKFLKTEPGKIKEINDIPFLPIEFFKSHEIFPGDMTPQVVFTSSGTTGQATSRHLVSDLNLYEQSFNKAFHRFYGNPKDWIILALLPSYLERECSSLIYMAQKLIESSGNPNSGFYLHDLDTLNETLVRNDPNKKILLIGVSFALLDLVEKYNYRLKNTVIMETGGMKGRRREMIREELHAILKKGFGVEHIHSEYGMTE